MNLILQLNKSLNNKIKRNCYVNKNKNFFHFLKLLLKLNIISKIISERYKYKITPNYKVKANLIYFPKKNHTIFLKKIQLNKLQKNNIYIYSTNTGIKSSLDEVKGGQLLTKIIFKN